MRKGHHGIISKSQPEGGIIMITGILIIERKSSNFENEKQQNSTKLGIVEPQGRSHLYTVQGHIFPTVSQTLSFCGLTAHLIPNIILTPPIHSARANLLLHAHSVAAVETPSISVPSYTFRVHTFGSLKARIHSGSHYSARLITMPFRQLSVTIQSGAGP